MSTRHLTPALETSEASVMSELSDGLTPLTELTVPGTSDVVSEAAPRAPSVVYVVGDPRRPSGPVKIGVTTDLRSRLVALQSGAGAVMPRGINAKALAVLYAYPGDRALERQIHRYYWQRRLVGEWFSLRPERARGIIAEFVAAQSSAEAVIARLAPCTCYVCTFQYGDDYPPGDRPEFANPSFHMLNVLRAISHARLGVALCDDHVALPVSHCDIDRAVALLDSLDLPADGGPD